MMNLKFYWHELGLPHGACPPCVPGLKLSDDPEAPIVPLAAVVNFMDLAVKPLIIKLTPMLIPRTRW